jgi:hypothetical protein
MYLARSQINDDFEAIAGVFAAFFEFAIGTLEASR